METKRIVISGVNGFVGHHLARILKQSGATIIGIGHESSHSDELNNIVDEFYSQDLVEAWPDTGEVDGVIHLAGLAAVGPSFDNPQRYINMNSAMVTNLCEYYLKQKKKPRVLLVSSGAIYDPNQQLPISEDGVIDFGSPYAVSKVLNESQAKYYRRRGLDCVVARPFNHIGPGQAPGFILPDFYSRISEATESAIKVGNIETKRDYTDVRDIVDAYAKLIFAPKLDADTYNICSGKSLSGRDILDKLKNEMGKPEIEFEVDPTLVRPTDIPEITGDSSKLQQELGWHPSIEISQTIADFVASKK